MAEKRIHKTIELRTVHSLYRRASIYLYARAQAAKALRLRYSHNVKDLEERMNRRKTLDERVAHMVNLRDASSTSRAGKTTAATERMSEGQHTNFQDDTDELRAAFELACVDMRRRATGARRIQAEQRLPSTRR